MDEKSCSWYTDVNYCSVDNGMEEGEEEEGEEEEEEEDDEHEKLFDDNNKKSIKRQRAVRRYHVPNSFRTNLRTDWKDDTKCDSHYFYDYSSTISNESCYLSISEAIVSISK
jgi:hypothetical protein